MSKRQRYKQYVLFMEMPGGLVWLEHSADIVVKCTPRCSTDYLDRSWDTCGASILVSGRLQTTLPDCILKSVASLQ